MQELKLEEIYVIIGGSIFDDLIQDMDPLGIADAFDDFVDRLVDGWESYGECSCEG